MPATLLCAVFYASVGVGFAFLDRSGLQPTVHFWRFAAWVVSALVFAVHIAVEAGGRPASSLRAALRVSFGAALGAFLLAVWILVHGRVSGAPLHPRAALALVAFPLVTGVPAFAVAFLAATVLKKVRRASTLNSHV